MDNASAADILSNIARASHLVLTTVVDHVKLIKIADISRIRLEGQLQHIALASSLTLEAVRRSSSLSNDPDIDRCLLEWLTSDEPKACLDTLQAMKSLLRDETWSRRIISMIVLVSKEDKIQEAIRLFQSQRASFHFLLATDIWNHREEVAHKTRIDRRNNVISKNIEQQDVIPNPPVSIVEGVKEVGRGVGDIERDKSDARTGIKTRGNELTVLRKEGQNEVDPKEVADFLGWLNGLTCIEKHEDTCALRQAETCTWLLETEIYRSWRRGGSPFLWLEGKPGSGKSVLASSVIEELKRSRCVGEVLAFFYCDFRHERTTGAHEVMRSLLTQLLRRASVDGVDCRDAVRELVNRKAEGAAPPNDMKLLTRLVCSTAQLHEHPLIVIDALDECKDVEKLLDALKELNDGHIRLFATSRPERIIKEALSDLPSVSLQKMRGAVSVDMERHILTELDSRQWLRILQPGLKQEIRFALLEGADGMFRWIQCQIDTLAKCTSVGEIRKALNSLPIGLDETYERILVAIDRNELQATLVRRALIWMVAALHPLPLPDIMEALKIDLERQTLDDDIVPTNEIVLLDACGSLVTHNAETDIVTLSHFSVKEYLTGQVICTRLPRYYVGLRDAHEQLARLCMCYMSLAVRHACKFIDVNHPSSPDLFDDDDDGDSDDDDDDDDESSDEEESLDNRWLSWTLFNYTLSDGFGHLAHLGWGHDQVLDDMNALQANFLQHPSKRKKIHRIFPTDRSGYALHWLHSKHDLVYYFLVRSASVMLLERFLDRAAPTFKDGTNPLLYAANFGKIEHARVLLSRGASPNNNGWVMDGSLRALPLEVAVQCGQDKLVDLFLAEGSRVPDQLFDSVLPPLNRVGYLLRLNRVPPLRIVRSLLRTDEFAEWASTLRERPLLHEVLQNYSTSDEGNVLADITRRLIQVGCDLSVHNEGGYTPIHAAASSGRVSVVEHMLSIITVPPDILLAAARAWRDRERMVRMLIDKGADVHARTSNGDSVIHVTLRPDPFPSLFDIEDPLDTVKVLVQAGCDSAARNSNGNMPLYVAATNGHVSVVEYLLSVHISLPSDILFAGARAQRHRVRMMRMLIDKRADIHTRTSNGDSVLHVAVGQYNVGDLLETVKILVNSGCNPAVCNSEGNTPLHLAVTNGHASVVEYLLSVQVTLPSDILLTRVNMQQNQARMVRMLIDKGADVHAHTSDGDSVLHVAVMRDARPSWYRIEGPLETVKTLIDFRCDPAVCNSNGNTPLHVAASRGHLSVVEYLLSVYVVLPSDILLAAARAPQERARMVRMVIDNKADIRACTSDGDSVLHVAVGLDASKLRYGAEDPLETVKILVECGCDPAVRNSGGNMPLHIAASRGHLFVVEYLLSVHVTLPSDILLATGEPPPGKRGQLSSMLIRKGAYPSLLSP